MRLIFMGTPDFAVGVLKKLIEAGYEILSVYTQPDKPKGRGHKLASSPVKEYALSLGIEVFTPSTLKDDALLDEIEKLKPDAIIVAAYGRILPKRLLDIPAFGCINVHASLLPKYRGAAPIQWSVINGEKETGVTIMQMNEGLDTGDIIKVQKVEISPVDTAGSMFEKLSEVGAELLVKALKDIESGKAVRTPQDDGASTYAPMLGKENAVIKWNNKADKIYNLIRGLYPFYVAKTSYGDVSLKIHEARPVSGSGKPGEVIDNEKRLAVACTDGTALEILKVQGENGKVMSACDYMRGHPIPKGTFFN